MDSHYDVIVVGGRCAGAATAMLLARGGLRVLVIEADPARAPTRLSTHALMRGGVLQLHRWGLLDAVVAAGTPAIRCDPVRLRRRHRDRRHPPGRRNIGAARPAPNRPRRAAAGCGPRGRRRDPRPARVTRLLTDGSRVRGIEGIERGTGTSLPRHRAAHHRRRRAGLDGRASGRRPVPPPRHGVGRDRLRLLPRTRARSLPLGVSTGGDRGRGADRRRFGLRLGRDRERTVRPAAVRRSRGHLPVAARRGDAGGRPLDRRRTARRHAPRLPRRSPAVIRSRPPARAGRWSAMQVTSRTPSPRTASPTPCATRNFSPARCSTHPAAGGPSSTPSTTTSAPATGSPSRCSISPNASRATTGTSRSCAGTFVS